MPLRSRSGRALEAVGEAHQNWRTTFRAPAFPSSSIRLRMALVVKDSLRRAQQRRALEGFGLCQHSEKKGNSQSKRPTWETTSPPKW